MSRTKQRNYNNQYGDEMRPVKSYKRLQRHLIQREYETV